MAKIIWEQTEKQKLAWTLLFEAAITELIFGGGAGGAKSFLGCGWLIYMCMNYPGTRWLMGRKKLKRLKETTLRTFFEVCKMWGVRNGRDYKYNAQDGVILWRNGSEILLADLAHQPSDPDYEELGSLELTGAFVDEVSQITFKCWSVINSRIRYKLDEYGLTPKCLGTCNPSKKWVYSEFYKPDKEGKMEAHKAFVKSLVKDNPFISKHYVAQLNAIKDKATKERLLNGNWEYDDDPSILFEFDTIQDLKTNKAKESREKYISGDVSRKGRDKMPICLWQGLQIKKVVKIPDEIRASTKKSAEWIIKFAQKHGVRLSRIILDEDGVGGGVVDNIPGCVGFVNNASAVLSRAEKLKRKKQEFTLNYGNIKTQCYFKFAEMSEQGLVGVDADAFEEQDWEDFVEELGQVKQKDADKDGTVYIVPKEKVKEAIGRSPDFSDMAMMRFYFEVKPRVVVDIIDID